MKCRICGYGGETKEACPRCGATGADLVDVPAMANGPAYAPDELDLIRDDVGFTNPNLHVRMDKHIQGSYRTINYPRSVDVSTTKFTIDREIPKKITKYLGDETSPRIPSLFPESGVTIIGSSAFADTDVYFVDIPEGITKIE